MVHCKNSQLPCNCTHIQHPYVSPLSQNKSLMKHPPGTHLCNYFFILLSFQTNCMTPGCIIAVLQLTTHRPHFVRGSPLLHSDTKTVSVFASDRALYICRSIIKLLVLSPCVPPPHIIPPRHRPSKFYSSFVKSSALIPLRFPVSTSLSTGSAASPSRLL